MRKLHRVTSGALRPVRRVRQYLLAPIAGDVAETRTMAEQSLRSLDQLLPELNAGRLDGGVVHAPPLLDVNQLLHDSRSAMLRSMPGDAQVICSAGCSGTWYFEWIERCYGPVRRHIGVEFYSPRPQDLPSYVSWIENTVQDMSGVDDGECDLVFSGQNIEHLWPEETAGFLAEAWRVLRPGGWLVVDSPNRNLTAPLCWSHPEHTIELTPGEAVELLTNSGFDVGRIRGIWMCRDESSGQMLPFDPNDSCDWSITERLVAADGNPEDAFIWWIEAQKAVRPPKPEIVSGRLDEIFADAWPERSRRMLRSSGHEEEVDGETWISVGDSTDGVLMFGPYMPLRAGQYTVGFDVHLSELRTHGTHDVDSVVCRLDVVYGSDCEPITFLDVTAADVLRDSRLVLTFDLDALRFGIQFRCVAFGGPSFRVRKNIELREWRDDRLTPDDQVLPEDQVLPDDRVLLEES